MKKLLSLLLALLLAGCTVQSKEHPVISATPTQTPEVPIPLETPEPPKNAGLLNESDPVEESYFDDVVFIGDSRFSGLIDYNLLTNATILAAVSLSVNELGTKKVISGTEGKQTK